MSERKFTLRKLEQYLKTKDFVINRVFHNNKRILFMTIKNDNLFEDVLVQFDDKFVISVDNIDIKTTAIEVKSGSPINTEELAIALPTNLVELNSSDMVDDGQRIKEGLTISNYKTIDINSAESLDPVVKQYVSQLEKFKECVKNLRYKFGILTYNNIYFIQRNNAVTYYSIRDKNNYIPVENINFIVSIDIENLFESIDTFVDDVIKLYKNFYKILSEAHKKQILALECQINTLTDVPRLLKTKNIKLTETSLCIDQTSNMLNVICQDEIRIKKLLTDNEETICKNAKDEKIKEQTRERLYNELDKSRAKKNKAQQLLLNLKGMYNNDLISFDYNIFKSVHLFEHFAEKVKNVL
jgi:hypothetical protein